MARQTILRRLFVFLLWGMMGFLLSLLMAGLISAESQLRPSVAINNRATATYTDPQTGQSINATSGQLNQTELIDPFGQILDCGGNEFNDYIGFRAALYEQASPLGDLGALVNLTRTDDSNGLPPNIYNENPYNITNTPVNGKRGVYNFLLKPSDGQTAVGRTYILVISPPAGSGLQERRVRIVIGATVGNVLSYTATALDGKPIGTNGQTSLSLTTVVTDAANIPLTFITLPFNPIVCQAQPIQITKTGDRAQAEPGDTALYRISVKNLSSAPVTNPLITDNLPLGFQFVNGSARAAIGNTQVPVTVTASGRSSVLR
jgi:conserved repeat domain